MITFARVFEHEGCIQIQYFDGQECWARISDGIDTYDDLSPNKDESEEDFLIRLKEFAWDKYLKPSEKTFATLVNDKKV